MCFVIYTKITYTHRSMLELASDCSGLKNLLSSKLITHYLKRQKQVQSNWWCQPTIWSSVAPLLLLPSIFPSIRGFSNKLALCIWWPKYQSFSLSISPSNDIQGCFPLGLTDLILQSEGLSRAFSSTIQKYQFFSTHFKAQFQFLMSSRAWVDKCFL